MKHFLYSSIFSILLLSCLNKKKTTEPGGITELKSPAADSCAEPYLFTDKNGTVFLSWIEKRGKESSLKFSLLSGNEWSVPVTIATGRNWFVNWADYPLIASDGSQNFLAHYLEKSDTAKFTYDIKIVSSADSGKTWGQPKFLNEDNIKAEHGFVSIIPYQDQFFACWLDGRKTASEENSGGHDGHHGEMSLRGAMIGKNGNKTAEWELDGKVCDCCQTGATVINDGIVVVYRDRSDDEVRDISVVRLTNGEWTAPKKIFADNWKINACPVNGPRVSSVGNHLAIAWFSMQDKKAEVKVVFSNNGGASFGKPIRIDTGNAIGRVDAEMLDPATAVVSWMEGAAIKTIKVHEDGTKDPIIDIASSSEKRSSGFPQMTRTGDKLIFAWTDDKAKTVRTARTE